MPRRVAIAFLASIAFSTSYAQQYPVKPVRFIVASTPGGGVDFVARLLAPKLTDTLGQQIIVENRPGGSSTIGYEYGIRAAPNGYTLLLITPSYSANPSLHTVKYDPATDFTAIVMIAKAPLVVVSHPSLPVKNNRELIRFAKAHPGDISYASTGSGTIIHLATAYFESMAGIKMTNVPYKGGTPALMDVVGGHVHLVFATPQLGLQQAKAGRVRALGVTSATRLPAAPDIPTIAEQGVPGYEVINWQALIGPKGLPRAVVDRLNAAINQAIAARDVEEKLQADGVAPAGGTPEQLHAQVLKEITVWRKVIKDARIKGD
jgi:tripartite-type tricarboxylate transporter receptor subunit TctC